VAELHDAEGDKSAEGKINPRDQFFDSDHAGMDFGGRVYRKAQLQIRY
jgi:hypothetical protein